MIVYLMQMSGINKVILLGSVQDNPVQQKSIDGSNEVSFTLLTVEEVKRGSIKAKHIERHLITAVSSFGCNIKTIIKGDKLFIQGKTVTKRFADQDNIMRYTTMIVVTSFEHFE